MSGEEPLLGTVSAGGVETDHIRFGEGGEPLVILPGLGLRSLRETARATARMYRPLGRGHTVYVLDYGRPLPQPCTVAALAAQTARAMDGLGLCRANVLGISMGGMIAQYLAIERPDLVGKLALAVTLSRQNEALSQASARWIALAERSDGYPELTKDVIEHMYSDGFRERFGQLLFLSAQRNRPKDMGRFIALARACLTCDVYDRLGQIRCPVLVIGGREDQIVTGRASEEIAERLGCQLYMYQGLGHAAYEEARDFTSRVAAFFDAPLRGPELCAPEETEA